MADKGKEPIVDEESEEEEVDAETSDEEEEEEPVKKKQKVEPKKKKKKKKSEDSDDEDSVNSDVVEDLSGDEVDTSNIIEGGRRARRGRPVSFTYAANDSEDDSDED